MTKESYSKIVSVNQMSEVLPYGDSFPQTAPPFHGATNSQEVGQIENKEAKELASSMVDLCMRLQQRSLSLAAEGDIIPLQAPVDPDLAKHVIGDSLGMDHQKVSLLNVRDSGRLTLPEAILADGQAMDTLSKFIQDRGERVIISPFAVDLGVQELAQELNIGYGQEWPHAPNPIVPDGKVWEYPERGGGWRLWRENSKARNYQLAESIEKSWVPEGDTASSYEEAGKQVGNMLFDDGHKEVGVKADINVDGMGNLRFRKVKDDTVEVIYEDESTSFRVDPDSREGVARLVEDQCKQHGIFVNEDHPATVQKWEEFLFGLTPSVEIYIPPLETGRSPFIINECAQIIENGAFVGSINPDPLTVDGKRLNETPSEFWENLGTTKEEFRLRHRRGYLQAWEKQRKLALEFGKVKQKEGEVGHRDFDFGVVVEEDGTYSPRMCESNARRTGTWVADTVGRKLWGNEYMQKGYVLTIDNIRGAPLDTDFRTIHSTFAKSGGLFVPETKTGIILNGHIRDGGNSRMLTTITGARMGDVWKGYVLTKDVVEWC
jgi:hypothetical protein